MCQPPAAHYAPAAELRGLVSEYQRTRTIPDRLTAVLVTIAGGVWDRYQFGPDRDDFTQDAVCHLLACRALDRIDVAGNPFSYLTTCILNHARKDRAKADRQARAESEYRSRVKARRLSESQDLAALADDPRWRRAARLHADGRHAEARAEADRVLAKLTPTDPTE